MRIRTVKPEFWSNPDLSRLSPFTRLLALGLLNYADDEGYFWADAALLRAALFPFEETPKGIEKALCELAAVAFVALYHGTNGRVYGKVVTFDRHQKIDRPSPSKIKPWINFDEPSMSNQGALALSSHKVLELPGISESSNFVQVTEVNGHGSNSLLEQGTGNREMEQGTGKIPALGAEKKIPEKTGLMRRVEMLFRRREQTVWSKAEKDAWARARTAVEVTSEDEWQSLEKFYALRQEPPPAIQFYRRQNLDTLLNNWTAELSKAVAHIHSAASNTRVASVEDMLTKLGR